ncbi:cyclic nucleotide-gated ion channel 1-like [Quercus suber]|uniref:cyclic nucleotide-gated ion channel 1-like n=1 Tax=Quercus suber TaxID=58331 RepID=UPI0032DE6E22
MYIDPQSQFLQTWNKIFMLSCLISMALDPLFFYIPVIHDKDKCLDSDLKLAIIACVLRSLFDAFYVLHIIFQFHTGFIAPSSQIFGRGETITYPVDIAKRYLSTYFLIDILSILPLPQVLVFVIIPSNKTQAPLFMKLVIFSQYVPRIIRICILHREETRTSGILILTPWTGAAYNLFLYMLASHVS